MYDSGPSEAELRAIGLLREDVTDTSDFEVWPDNWLPYEIFCEVSDQWRMGQGGPVGLDLNVVFQVMDLFEINSRDERLDTLRAIRVMSSSAITQMHKS